jgi:hypothetical protein
MDNDTAYCIEQLVNGIEENKEGNWKYSSDSERNFDRLPPIIIENLDLYPNSLRISPEFLEYKLHDLIFEVRNKQNPAEELESRLPEFRDQLYERDLEEYTVAFPLNFDSKATELLPDTLQVGGVVFEYISQSEWEQRFLPDYDDSHEKAREQQKLMEFLDESPNRIDNPRFTYWYASFKARDERYAVEHIIDQLEIQLGIMNYAATLGHIQTHSISSKPWPDRWGELREPFIYLVHNENQYITHYWGTDATLREPDSPHTTYEEVFETVLTSAPTFQDKQPLDGRLLNSIKAFQAAMTEPSERESFFEFWRGIEILTLVEEGEKMTEVVERAAALIDWGDPVLGRIRRQRAQQKRNEYVHEGAGLRVTTADRNLVKTLHSSLINHYFDKRDEWKYEEMKFVLDNFTTNEDEIDNLRRVREQELDLIDWFEEIAKLN